MRRWSGKGGSPAGRVRQGVQAPTPPREAPGQLEGSSERVARLPGAADTAYPLAGRQGHEIRGVALCGSLWEGQVPGCAARPDGPPGLGRRDPAKARDWEETSRHGWQEGKMSASWLSWGVKSRGRCPSPRSWLSTSPCLVPGASAVSFTRSGEEGRWPPKLSCLLLCDMFDIGLLN